MNVTYEKFYLDYGLRTYMGLASPKVFPVKFLPRNSILHYLTEGASDFPDKSSLYVKNSGQRVILENLLELLPDNHASGKRSVSLNNLVTDFIRKNNQFQHFDKPLSEVKNESQLIYCNYNLVRELYKYPTNNNLAPYWVWFDRQVAMWDHVEKLCKISQRNHFFEFEVPMELCSKSRLTIGAQAVTSQTALLFNTSDKKFLLDFWKWINPETRGVSALGRVSVEHLRKITILFKIKDGRSSVVNLGFLNSWIKGQPNQTDRPRVSGLNFTDIQLLFLKMLMTLQTFNVEMEASQRESETSQEDDSFSLETNLNGNTSPVLSVGKTEMDGFKIIKEPFVRPELDNKASVSGTTSNGSSSNISEEKAFEEFKETATDKPITLEDILKTVSEETESLEAMEERRDKLRGVDKEIELEYNSEIPEPIEEIHEKVFRSRNPQERLIEKLDTLVANGTITAADYRKVMKTVETQDSKPDPYGRYANLKEASTVLPEDIEISEKSVLLPSDDRVIDRSMTRSTVEALDREYVSKTMSKDIMASIMGVQNTGVMVSEIQTEIQHSVLGAFEQHSISLKPLNGQSSTIRIKIPVVDEDGTFKANGVRYHMRKQRVDLPIRKIRPDWVGLSSYYGKMFIFRSPKKANSSLAFIVKHLTSATLGEVENIPKVTPADVFDNSFKAPFIYNAIAAHYKGFTVKNQIFGDLFFNFDHLSIDKEVDSKQISLLEKDGCRVVGKTGKGNPIYVDNNNDFFVSVKEGVQPLGDLFDILEINRANAPVDYAVTKVMGKVFPVGLLLGRAIGFRALVKLTKANHRLVKGRQQKNIQPFEFPISFGDYSYIFDRRDMTSSLIFGGFQACEKQLKVYIASTYDDKQVYENLIESLGGGITIIRELDLLETSYVDPTTKNTLKAMKEPETFLGLLIRSCELLTTYHHPDSQDMDHQEIRGYERFAGAIYKESIKSIRAFQNRNISGRSKVEMSPFAVWQGLMEDPSMKTCEDINPVQNLKMHESVTFVGEGGRSKEAFTKDARAFNERDVGIISEASVDSGDVGINIFLSASPQFKNLRGMKDSNGPAPEAANYLSSSMMLAVGVQHDDFTVRTI